MREVPRGVENCCGHFGRVIVFLLTTASIVASVLLAFRCDFYQFNTIDGRPSPDLEPPFSSATTVNVGLFSYRIVRSADPSQQQDSCQDFPDQFNDFDFFTENGGYYIAAQYCIVVAACVGFVGWALNLVETLFCNFYCSSLLTSVLLIVAGACQGCTFLIFAEHTFCLKKTAGGNHSCKLDFGSYMSFGSTAGFVIAGILLGWIPRPDACFGNYCCRGRPRDEKKRNYYDYGGMEYHDAHPHDYVKEIDVVSPVEEDKPARNGKPFGHEDGGGDLEEPMQSRSYGGKYDHAINKVGTDNRRYVMDYDDDDDDVMRDKEVPTSSTAWKSPSVDKKHHGSDHTPEVAPTMRDSSEDEEEHGYDNNDDEEQYHNPQHDRSSADDGAYESSPSPPPSSYDDNITGNADENALIVLGGISTSNDTSFESSASETDRKEWN